MEILFWLLPAAAATLVAMVWVGWWGREGRGEVDRDTAARRLGEALSRERGTRPGYAVPPRPAEPSSGIALRPSKVRPVVLPVVLPAVLPDVPGHADIDEGVTVRPATSESASDEVRAEEASADEQTTRDRRAS